MNNYIKKFRYIIFGVGLLLSIGTASIGYGFTSFSIQLAIWASVPYIVFLVISSLIRNNSAIIGSGILILGLDIFIHVYVIFFPGSSTDVLALLFMPFWLIILITPVGFFGGWIIGKAIRKFKSKQKEDKGEVFIH
ncbi:MAG: hypothetical protein HY754_15095 [Nitrospirae bacterium]|nr:hypothetical protein [Nitrospirota bacterium]